MSAQVAQLCMTRPATHSGKFNTSGALDDLHGNSAQRAEADGVSQMTVSTSEMSVAVDGVVSVQCVSTMEDAIAAMADVAMEGIENNVDADGTLTDLLDIEVMEMSGKLSTSEDNKTEAPSAIPLSNVNATPQAWQVQPQVTAIAPPGGLQEVRVPLAAVDPVRPPGNSAAIMVLDLLISLIISAIVYVGGGVILRNIQ
jgi:hypothetical protein